MRWLLILSAGLAFGSDCSKTSVGFSPFIDPYPRPYQGQTVGPPFRTASNLLLGLQQAAQITPRDATGAPDPNGKIVLLSIGLSNTTQEFSAFIPLAMADSLRNPAVLPVDGAVGGETAAMIAAQPDQYWTQVDARLQAARVTAAQVQAAWLKEADANPTQAFPKYPQQLQAEIAVMVQQARARFPNLKIIFLSSRIYAGYADISLNPEPYAYQSGFAVKWLIEQQSADGPWLGWGPYLWADGMTPRLDGLTWACADLNPSDGTHPSDSGRLKVARMLLDFFHTDPDARTWYVAPQAAGAVPSIAALVNAAGYGSAMATGSLATIFGTNLASSVAAASAFPLPRELAGTRVDVDGTPALLYYVSPGQINFVLPPLGGQSVQVIRGQTASTAASISVGLWGPGLFTLDSSPGGPAAAEHADGTLVNAASPARRGEAIQVFGTGWGIMNPALLPPIAAPIFSFGSSTAPAGFIGTLPLWPGLTQFNVAVPADAPLGSSVPVNLRLVGSLSNTASIAVGE